MFQKTPESAGQVGIPTLKFKPQRSAGVLQAFCIPMRPGWRQLDVPAPAPAKPFTGREPALREGSLLFGKGACFSGFEPALRRGSLLYGKGACHQIFSLLYGKGAC